MSDVVVLSKREVIEVAELAARTVVEELTKTNGIAHAPELMTMKQLCDYLQCSRSSVNKWIKEMDLPVHYLGEDPRFYKYEVDFWLQKQKH